MDAAFRKGDLNNEILYLRDIGKVPLLTWEQEIELAKRVEAGIFAREILQSDVQTPYTKEDLELLSDNGAEAKNHMIEANLRLVVSIAKRYNSMRLGFLDIVQEGNEGLIRAVELFNYKKAKKRFANYAAPFIRGAIIHAIGDSWRIIRVPFETDDLIRKIHQEEDIFFQKNGVLPNVNELATALGISPNKVADLQSTPLASVSLDALDYEGGVLGDRAIYYDMSSIDNEEDSIQSTSIRRLNVALGHLSVRYEDIISRRFGLKDYHPMKLIEIATDYNVGYTRINQIEALALQKLRASMESEDNLAESFES